MSKTIALRLTEAQAALTEQRRWIEEHGESRVGYIARYGPTSGDPTKPVSDGGRYGDGGEAIYAADHFELLRRKDEVDRLTTLLVVQRRLQQKHASEERS